MAKGDRGYLSKVNTQADRDAWYNSDARAVPMSSSEMTEHFHEVMFHTQIQRMNAELSARGGQPVTKRQAIQMRDRMGEYLSGMQSVAARSGYKGDVFGRTHKTEFIEALAQTTASCVPGYQLDKNAFSKIYTDGVSAFNQMACRDDIGDNEHNFLPLSPYAPSLRYRAAALSSGNRLMFADMEDLADYAEEMSGSKTGSAYPTAAEALRTAIPLYAAPAGAKSPVPPMDNEAQLKSWQVGPAMTQSDQSGASLMRLLMDDKTYRSVEKHINMGKDGKGVYADPASLQRSFEVIRRLQDQGVRGTFKPDVRPGQLKYVIPSLAGKNEATGASDSLDIRVIDPYEPNFMGSRVYQGGITYRLSTDKLKRTAQVDENGRQKMGRDGKPLIKWENEDYTDFSVDDCLKVIQFARGGAIEESGGARRVGAPCMVPNHSKDRDAVKFTNGSYIAYSNKSPRVSRFGPLLDKQGRDTGFSVMLRVDSDRERSRAYFSSPEAAEAMLRESVQTAREGFAHDVGVDELVEQYNSVAGTPAEADYTPTLSGNKVIASVQERYWSLLTGANKDLAKVPVAKLASAEGLDDEESDVDSLLESEDGGVYTGTQEEKIRAHLADLTDAMVGTFEPDAEGKRFNAAVVAQYMTGSGVFRNTEDLIGAMQVRGIGYTELKGNDFYKKSIGDRMLQFDEASAKPIDDPSLDPWLRERGRTIVNALNRASCVNKAELLPRTSDAERSDPRKGFKPGDFVDIAAENKAMEDAIADPAEGGAKMVSTELQLKNKRARESAKMSRAGADFWSGSEVTPGAVMIDKNGVVKYDVCRINRQNISETMLTPITGYIGQLMPPDKDGVVHTNFAASDNYDFVPVIQATVAPDSYEGGRAKSVAERMRLMTYDRFIDQAIEANIAKSVTASRDLIGSPVGINGAVRHMQSKRYQPGELDKLPEDQAEAIKTTRFVRMATDIVAGSNQDTIYEAQSSRNYDPLDDMRVDPIVITRGRDMTQLYEDYAGYLDINYTGLALSQGRQLALAEGAGVAGDGSIVPVRDAAGKPVDSPSAITRYLRERCSQFDMGDRQNMGASAVLQGKDHRLANVAMIPIGGWTFEDQVVMSKQFADSLGITQQGDKVSDYHGNKGVTGLIIDPEMPAEEAERRGLTDVVAWFRANDGVNGRPRLDIIQNMGSAFSRNNGGLYREAIANGCENLMSPSGLCYPGGIGKLDIVKLEQTADHKSSDLTVEEEDSLAHLGARTTRNDGAQAGWAHMANGRYEAMAQAAQKNGRAWEDAREYLNLLNIDFDETGALHFGIREHEGEHRPVFETQPLQYSQPKSARTAKKPMVKAMLDQFAIQAERQGGYIEIPFPIKFPDSGAVDKDGKPISAGQTPLIPDSERSEASKKAYAGPVYKLPLLDSRLRTGQEFQDETVRFHDYTKRYQRIMTAAYTYRFEQAKADEAKLAGKFSAKDQRKLDEALSGCQVDAQSAYNSMAQDVIDRKVSGKRNMFRDDLLSVKRQAVTAVAVHDPRLPFGVSVISSEAAKASGFSDEVIERNTRRQFKPGQVDRMMGVTRGAPTRNITRDPVIVHTGESAERLQFDDRVPEGGGTYVCASNTAVIGTQKQLDHDGDTVAVFQGHRSDRAVMAQETRMLNLAEYDDKTGQYKLFYEKAQDLAIGWAVDPGRKASYDALAKEINESERSRRALEAKGADLDARFDAGEISAAQLDIGHAQLGPDLAASDELRYDQLRRLSAHAVSSFADAYLDKLEGKLSVEKMPYMNFTDAQTVIQSLDNIQAIGYKGKPATLDAFAKTLGVTYDRTPDGEIDYGSFKDLGHSGRDYDELGLTRIARAYQTGNTGSAGHRTILSVNAMGRDPVKGVQENRYIGVPEGVRTCELVSHLVTQATLQVKHGPDDVAIMRDMQKALNMLDKGVKMEYDATSSYPGWRSVKGPDGLPQKATPQEFQQQLLDVYNAPKGKGGMGFSLSPELARVLTDLRTDPDDPGHVMDITKEGRQKRTPTLQQLAYKGAGETEFATLQSLTQQGASMLSVPGKTEPAEWNRVYAPDIIAGNLQVARHNAAHPDDIQPMRPLSHAVRGPRKLFTAASDKYARTRGGSLTAEPVPEDGTDNRVDETPMREEVASVPAAKTEVKAETKPPFKPSENVPAGLAAGVKDAEPGMDAPDYK